MYRTRCNPGQLRQTMDLLSTSTEHVNAIKELGFGSLFNITCTRLFPNLVQWLVEHFNPDDTTLRISKHSTIKITAEDVHNVLGIPIGPRVVDEHPYSHANDPELQRWKIRHGKENGPLTSQISSIVTNSSNADQEFKLHFVIYIVTKLLVPSNRSSCNWRVHKALKDLSACHQLNFCAYTLNTLATQISKYKEDPVNNQCIGACLYFLQVNVSCLFVNNFHTNNFHTNWS